MGEPPKSLDVTFTDRGFECVVHMAPAGGCFGAARSGIGLTMVFGFFAVFFGFFVAVEELGDAAVVFVIAGILGLMAVVGLGFVGLKVLGRKKARVLKLDGNILTFDSMNGPVRMTLQEVKAVDVVPVGLGIRPHKGQTHHILMTGASEAERVWLDDAIETARDRHGTSSEVPEEIRELRD